jgi:glycosyltransferase involved in cell wall biosynthesis
VISPARPLRIVQVVPYPVLPPLAGGKVRIVQLARALAELGVELTVVAPYHLTQRRALAARERFTLRQVPYAPFILPFFLVDRPFPYGALVSFHPGYRAVLPVSLASFDICQIDHPAFVDLARRLPASIPLVYGSQNVEFDYVSAECRSGWVRRIAGKRIRGLEAELVSRANHVFACTSADARRFADLYAVPADRVTVLPNGIDLMAVDRARLAAATRQDAGRSSRRRAIFAGSDVAHNRRAVDAIIGRIAPALEGEIDFVIIGPCARRIRGRVGRNVHLDPAGDVAAQAGPATVGLNPVIAGSGSSLKVLHYLACDLPVISTPFGMRGFDDLAPWVVTAELAEFADTLRQGLAVRGGVRDRLATYEWRALARQALNVYQQLSDRA